MAWVQIPAWTPTRVNTRTTDLMKLFTVLLSWVELYVCCWFSPLPACRRATKEIGDVCTQAILSIAPRGVFSGHSGFPLSSKPNTSKFQFDQVKKMVDKEPLKEYALPKILIYLVIYLFNWRTYEKSRVAFPILGQKYRPKRQAKRDQPGCPRW